MFVLTCNQKFYPKLPNDILLNFEVNDGKLLVTLYGLIFGGTPLKREKNEIMM